MFVYLMIYSAVYLIFNSVRDNDELKLFTGTFVIKTLNLCSKLCCKNDCGIRRQKHWLWSHTFGSWDVGNL